MLDKPRKFVVWLLLIVIGTAFAVLSLVPTLIFAVSAVLTSGSARLLKALIGADKRLAAWAKEQFNS